MEEITRRTVVKAAAWSIPIIAVASAVPLSAASEVPPTKIPISCVYLQNHGHGGDTSNDWWQVTYNDGSSVTLDNGTVMRDAELKKLCEKNHNK